MGGWGWFRSLRTLSPRCRRRAACGPAMAQQRALPQSKETLLQSYNKRLKDDVKSIMDNFTEIIKTAKVGAGGQAPAPPRPREGEGSRLWPVGS